MAESKRLLQVIQNRDVHLYKDVQMQRRCKEILSNQTIAISNIFKSKFELEFVIMLKMKTVRNGKQY